MAQAMAVFVHVESDIITETFPADLYIFAEAKVAVAVLVATYHDASWSLQKQ